MIIGIDLEDGYYRVVLRYGTHTLHSEKLNLETAMDVYYYFRKDIEK